MKRKNASIVWPPPPTPTSSTAIWLGIACNEAALCINAIQFPCNNHFCRTILRLIGWSHNKDVRIVVEGRNWSNVVGRNTFTIEIVTNAATATPFQSNRIYIQYGKVKLHHPIFFFSLALSHRQQDSVHLYELKRIGNSTEYTLRFAKQSKNKMANQTHNGTIVSHKWAFYWCSVALVGHSGTLTHHVDIAAAFCVYEYV